MHLSFSSASVAYVDWFYAEREYRRIAGKGHHAFVKLDQERIDQHVPVVALKGNYTCLAVVLEPLELNLAFCAK